MEDKHNFHLSENEFEFLKQVAMGDESFANLLTSHVGTDDRRVSIRLSNAEVERLRDFLTTTLAEIGFDENYFPNAEGGMLERLIDKFYLR
jgi:hypothetical protein